MRTREAPKGALMVPKVERISRMDMKVTRETAVWHALLRA